MAPRVPTKGPKRRYDPPFSISLTFFLKFTYFISYWILFGSYCLLYWFLLPPLGSYWLLLPPIVSYCLFAAPIVSYWLLMAPLAPVVSYWLLLVPFRSYWLLLALYFSKKKRASRSFAKTGFYGFHGFLGARGLIRD